MQKFSSLVNSVSLVDSCEGWLVRKVYSGVALGTGITVPPDRKIIEARVLRVLSRLNFYGFRVPRLLNEGVNYIDIEYLEAVPAAECIHLEKETCSQSQWNALGSSLAMVESHLFASAIDVFDGLYDVERECAEILCNLKTPNIKYKHQSINSISLGDVSLTNLMIAQSGMYLLDFEFCHRARAGRDVGQLISQLLSHSQTSSATAIERGYLDAGGSKKDLFFWVTEFNQYHKVKNGKN